MELEPLNDLEREIDRAGRTLAGVATAAAVFLFAILIPGASALLIDFVNPAPATSESVVFAWGWYTLATWPILGFLSLAG